jgi:hypothetical protein
MVTPLSLTIKETSARRLAMILFLAALTATLDMEAKK